MRHDDSFEFRPGFDPSRARIGGSGFETGVSLSGYERNHLFASHEGEFLDVSGVSGLDHPADARAFAWLDFDRDGWLDFAVVNANAPMLQLFRNRVGDDARNAAGVIALRFVGGNDSAEARPEWSNRDGYGVRVEAELSGRTLHRTHRAGEGFAAQNSDTLLIGLGPEQSARVKLRWPSGRVQDLGTIEAGALVTAHENPQAGPAKTGAAVQPYRRSAPTPERTTGPGRAADLAGSARLDLGADDGAPNARLRVYTTMATWCETCRGELPRIAALRESFSRNDVALHAVPVDPDDSREKLQRYLARHRPAYEMLIDLDAAEIGRVEEVLRRELRREPLPASIVTDSVGRVLSVEVGVPSLSALRRLLETQ